MTPALRTILLNAGQAGLGVFLINGGANGGNPFPNWRAARAKAVAGNGRGRILCGLGDSTTAGYGASGTGIDATAADRLRAYPAYLASRLASAGVPTRYDNFAATNNLLAQYPSADTRLSLGAGWGASSNKTLGGPMWVNSTTTNAWAFTPTKAFDTIVVKWLIAGGLGTFTVDIGGAALATINTSIGTAATMGALVIPTGGGPAAGTVNLKRVSGTNYVCYVETYDSTVSDIQVVNGGWSGGTPAETADVTGGYSSLSASVAQAPALSLIMEGINAWNGGPLQSVPVFSAYQQTKITALKAVGDVLILSPFPTQNAIVSLATQRLYVEEMKALAFANDVPMLDLFSAFGSLEMASALGYAADTKHPNSVGYARMGADLIANYLLAV